MRKLKLFFACLLMAVLSIGQMWGADPSVKSTFSTSSTISENKVTENGVTWTLDVTTAAGSPTITTGTANQIQGLKFGSSGSNYYSPIKFSTDYFKNYNVKSVTIYEKNNGSKIGKLTVKQGSTTIGTASHSAKTSNWETLTASGTKGAGGTLEVTYEVAQASYFNYIEVVYEEGTTCTSEITITKADDPANGTFELSDEGAVCIDGGNATVNVTATPNTGYHLATVVSAEGTIGDIEGNTCQITNIGASTTISVTFAENPKYKVSFNVGGSTASQADITEASAGAGITLPDGPTPTCTGWTFAGWKETSAIDVETTTTPTLLAAGANYKPAANCTLYAVYKRTESGDVEDQDVTETFENQDAGTDYQKTLQYSAANSNAGIAWEMYYGTVSTNDKIAGDKSAQMRWYSSATSNIPYIKTTNTVSGLQSVNFKARVSNTAVKMSLWYSTDGTNWTISDVNQETFTATGTAYDFSATISGTVGTNYYIKIGEDGGTAPSSGNYKLIIDAVQFNYKAAASTTYYLSTPTCSCTQLDAPTVSVPDGTLTYNGAKLTWGSVTDADKYKVYIYDNDDNEIEHDDAVSATEYTIAATLTATTTYKYSVQAISDTPEDHCASDLTEGSFETKTAPAATLTLSEIGETHNFAGNHTVGETVTLPLSATECSKTFVGWSANASCAVAPEYAPGASYTLAAVSQTLYAVYATPSGTSTWEEIFAVPTAGDYAIYSDGHLMEAAISSNRFQNAAASVTDGKLDEAPAASCIWTVSINASDYFQFKNGTKYASSTNSNNQGALTEDATDTKAQWTIAYSEGFVIENVGRKAAAGNYTLRNNGDYGWGSYSASQGTAPRLFKKIIVYTGFSTSCDAALAKPTFSVDPEDGPFDHVLSVELAAAEGTIYYNINSVDDPTSASTPYTGAIDVDACGSTTIKAIAISSTNQSLVASATYVLNLPIPENAENNPYSIATAKSVIDGGCYNNEDVYVTGTVASAQLYNSGTYTVTLEDGFQFYYLYKAAGETPFNSGDETIEAGDVLVAFGKLGMHNTTYQLDHGYLVSRTPAASKTSIANDIDHPYTVAEAIAFCNDPITYDLNDNVYVQGIAAGAPNSNGTFNIYDEGEETTLFQLYKSNLGTYDDIKALDVVTAYGKILKFSTTVYEMNQGAIVAVTPYVAPVVDVTGVELNETAITLKEGLSTTLVATVNPNDASNKNVTWESSNPAVASVANGVVTAETVGTATITVTTEDGGFTATCAVTVIDASARALPNAVFQKVTATGDITDGKYLIVYEGESSLVAFDGALETLDAVGNNIAVTVEGGYIIAPADAAFTIDITARTLKSYSGKYIGVTSNSNGLKQEDASTNYFNTYAIDANENAVITADFSGTTMTLRFNKASNQDRFRYYKNAGQENIQLYKMLEPENVRENLTDGKWGTICPAQTVMLPTGASFYAIAYVEKHGNEPYKVFYDEIAEGESLTAGQPYIFIAEGEAIKGVKVGDAATEGINDHGFIGKVEQYDFQVAAEDVANYRYYMVKDNSIRLCGEGWFRVGAERAYLDMSAGVNTVAHAPAAGRRRVCLTNQEAQVATGMDALNASETPVKMMIDGQLFILRGEKMYNANGQLVK